MLGCVQYRSIEEGLQLLEEHQQQSDLVLGWHVLEALVGLQLLHVQVNVLVFCNHISTGILKDGIKVF